MRSCYRTITLALASLLPLASSFAADAKLVKAVSDHFELYTTDNEAAAKAAITHFETVRGYLLKAFHSDDPFSKPVRIVGFRSPGEYGPYIPRNGDLNGKAFAEASADQVTIAMAGLKPADYQFGVRDYVMLLLNRTAPKMPYWLRMGFSELYCTLRMENGQLMLGSEPYRDFRRTVGTNFDMALLFALNGGAMANKGSVDFYAPSASVGIGSTTLGSAAKMASVESDQTVDYPVLLWQLTHMLLFKKEYSSKFGPFVAAVTNGEDSAAAVQRIFDLPLAGLKQDLLFYVKLSSHAVAGLKFQLDKPVTPQVSQLSPGDSAAVLAELKAAK